MARSYNTPSTTSNHENSDATLMEFFTNNAAAINAILHQHSSTETFNSSTDDLAWNNAVAALHNITHSRPATPVLLRRMYATSNAFSPQPSESSTVVSPAVSQPASPPPLTVISPAVSQPASPPPLSNTLSLAHNDNNYSDYTQYDDYSSYNNQQSQPNDFCPRSTLIPRVLPPINWPSDLYPPIQPTAELQAQTPFPNMESSPVLQDFQIEVCHRLIDDSVHFATLPFELVMGLIAQLQWLLKCARSSAEQRDLQRLFFLAHAILRNRD